MSHHVDADQKETGSEIRFLLDGMLGTLTRWLRICGYDAEFMNSAPDGELIDRALKTRRVVLTRDKLLFRKTIKAGVEAILVEGDEDVEMLSFLSKRLGIRLDPEQSKCPKCGGVLKYADKKELKGSVSEKTYKFYDDFWICDSCRQIYWKGSHWRSIVNTLGKASEKLNTASP